MSSTVSSTKLFNVRSIIDVSVRKWFFCLLKSKNGEVGELFYFFNSLVKTNILHKVFVAVFLCELCLEWLCWICFTDRQNGENYSLNYSSWGFLYFIGWYFAMALIDCKRLEFKENWCSYFDNQHCNDNVVFKSWCMIWCMLLVFIVLHGILLKERDKCLGWASRCIEGFERGRAESCFYFDFAVVLTQNWQGYCYKPKIAQV